MINDKRIAMATGKLIAQPLTIRSAPAGHIGNALAKLRKIVLGF